VTEPRLEARRASGPPAIDPAVALEAFALPLILLTVALLGGLRIGAGGSLVFIPPPLMSLVLAVLLVAALYRSGTLDVERLLAPHRGALANAGGLVIMGALFFASAQIFNTLTPEAGLMAFAFNLAYLVLFANTLAAAPDRERQLASLLVIFGSAFVVKYVVLASIYSPEPGLTKRVVLALVEGVSLGGLAYQAPGPATGYVAFAAAGLFLVALALLPRRRAATAPIVTSTLVLEDDDDRALAPREPPAHDLADR
jgi:hypothetical protein